MRTTAISDLKARLSEYLAWVKRGEEVVVTERGKPVARIVPVEPEAGGSARVRALVARGLLRPGRKLSARVVGRLPVCAVPEAALLRALEEEREDRA